jgi:hypothetical protein
MESGRERDMVAVFAGNRHFGGVLGLKLPGRGKSPAIETAMDITRMSSGGRPTDAAKSAQGGLTRTNSLWATRGGYCQAGRDASRVLTGRAAIPEVGRRIGMRLGRCGHSV